MTPDEYYNNLYLAHHGIKGQKHGLRRWQNRDGSLTPAGREHYGVGDPREGGSYDDYSNEYNDYDRAQAEEREYQRNRQEKIDKMVRIGVGVAAVAVTAYALKKLSSKNVKEVSEETISEGAEKAKEVVNKMKGKSISDYAKMDVSKLESKPGNFNFSRDKTEAKEAASFLEKLNGSKNNQSSGISSIAKMDVSKLKSQPGNFNFTKSKTPATGGLSSIAKMDTSKLKSWQGKGSPAIGIRKSDPNYNSKQAAYGLKHLIWKDEHPIGRVAKMDVSKLESKPGNFNFTKSSSSGSGLSSIAKMDVSKLKSQPGNFNFGSSSTMSKNLSSIASKASSGKSTVDNVSSMLDSLNKDLLKRK